MALSGLDIYKLLPKTNCKQCGFATCLAFAMQMAKKASSVDNCPFISQEAKDKIISASLPPIKSVKIESRSGELTLGGEKVLFRHEEKFFNPCAIGIVIDDDLSEAKLIEKIADIKRLSFERVGEILTVDVIGLKYSGIDKDKYISSLKVIVNNCDFAVALICDDLEIIKKAVEVSNGRFLIVYCFGKAFDLEKLSSLNNRDNLSFVIVEKDLDSLSLLTEQSEKLKFKYIIIDTGEKSLSDKLWDLTQIRRLSLKKNIRSLGYPVSCIIEETDGESIINKASCYILKYASMVFVKTDAPEVIFPLLTLRQNIYSDPQKPLQVEPKSYAVGSVDKNSPVLVTTNFSLSYFTVLSEVEASRIPSYIISVDTEGMSVLTAWAAEKLTPESITKAIKKDNIEDKVDHKKIVIPGYVSVMSGDLEEKSGWQVTVGPKEASGIPSFLKKYK
ncbi:MAG: acetyl-CoA decarbonylase/synthase complex subunit gamma [Candidatus Gygaella obscura]|nr:acetyl-CoA decarbonylase/synthase complex subunit gamma [Candidatus Gygaella obscura]